MFWEVPFLRPRHLIRAVNILCAIMLAGMYVFTYYDYLHTVITQDPMHYSTEQPTYRNGQLGIITIDR